MSSTTKHIIQQSIRIFLMLLWLYVAIDKALALEAFQQALQRQPLPSILVAVLYWGLPLVELLIGLLFIGRYRQQAYLLSAILLFLFSVYIALGLAGFYPKRPCGCASVFSLLSWSWHLVVNLILLSLSILGWYLTGPTGPMAGKRQQGERNLAILLSIPIRVPLYHVILVVRKRFPEKFAVFPAAAGRTINYDTGAAPRKMCRRGSKDQDTSVKQSPDRPSHTKFFEVNFF